MKAKQLSRLFIYGVGGGRQNNFFVTGICFSIKLHWRRTLVRHTQVEL